MAQLFYSGIINDSTCIQNDSLVFVHSVLGHLGWIVILSFQDKNNSDLI